MKTYIFASCLLLLSACGFTPLYAAGPAGAGNITVDEIAGREGHTLRKNILLELAPGLPGVDGPATLTITVNTELGRLALQPDEAATRTDIIASANYVLAYGDTAISGASDAETSFLVPLAPYSDITAQIDAKDRAMTVLARRIVDDLRLQLAAQP